VPLAQFAGDRSVPLLGETIPENLARVATQYADRDAIVDVPNGTRLSYREFTQAVDDVTRALLAAGVEHGDRVAVWSVNRVEWVLAQYALSSIGAIVVGVNPAFRTGELNYLLQHADVMLVLAAVRLRDSDYGQMLAGARQQGWRGNWVLMDTPDWEQFLAAGRQVDEATLVAARQKVTEDDAFCLQYTSGTTGAPKGAIVSHRAALNNGRFQGLGMNFTERDRLCVCLPIFHAFGLIASNLTCTTHGAAIVLSGPTFDPVAVMTAIEREGCTTLHGVPTMYIALLNHPDFDSFDLSTLRTGVFGGSPCPAEVVRQATTRMHLKDLTVAYGMSELASVTTQTRVDDSLERKAETVGRVSPHVEGKIVSAAGETVQTGEVGELVMRGYTRMIGYWGDDERTAEAIDAQGWLHTGDLATMDGEGYVQIVGRVKDMVIRGGENIYPREIEGVLHELPGVVDAHVIGVPDAKYGEELLAAVHLVPGSSLDAEAVRVHCREHLAYFKVPAYVVFTDDFPTTPNGKVRKAELRDRLIADLPSPTAGPSSH
jgi:fatty-acyl-CoA synthase